MTKRTAKFTLMLAGILSAANFSFSDALLAHGPGGHGEVYIEPKRDPVETLTGEVLSLPCYLKHGALTRSYERCARSPLSKKYFSAALLTAEGALYLLVMDHEEAFNAVRKLLSKQVMVRGRKVERGVLQAIVLRSINNIEKSKK